MLVAPALAGWLVFVLWDRVGLPPHGDPLDAPFPGLWRWFFAVWLPAMFPAFTLVHAHLWRRAGHAPPGAAWQAGRWDRRSYVLLPLFLALMLAWPALGAWRLSFAGFYLGTLFAKTLLAVVTVYRQLEDDRAPPRRLAVSLFLVAGLLYAFAGGYVVTALSTAGDEHVYLLNTHSLYADGDLDLRNNIERRDYARFYWGRPSPATWNVPLVGFPTFLLPGYALGTGLFPAYPLAGRLAAVLAIAACAAGVGAQAYRLCRDLGAARTSAFWAWVVVALTPPVLVNSAHVYPELPAALLLVVGVRAVLRLPAATWPALGVVAGATAGLALLKDRYAPLGVGVAAWALARLARPRGRLALGIGLAGTLAAAAVVALPRMPGLFPNLGSPARALEVLAAWNRWMPLAALGLVADQEFGLLYYAPHWALAVPGMVLLWRRRRDVVVGLAGVALLYVVVLVKYRWIQWDAGWTPPPRFILSAAPLLAPFVAAVFDQVRGRLFAAVNTAALAWSAGLGIALTLVPFWRYNDLDGRSTVLEALGAALRLDLARFLPSLRAPTLWTWAAVTGGALALALLTWYWARRAADATAAGPVLLRPAAAAALVGSGAAAWVALAAVVPTWVVEGPGMRHSGGVRFGSYQDQEIVWVMSRDTDVLDHVVTWPGLTEITIVAGAGSAAGSRPSMTLFLDGREVRAWALETGDRQWLRAEYRARVPTGFGHPELRLRFTGLVPRVQHAYVGRIGLRWLGVGAGEP
jgi:hypothetical protein